MSQQLVKRGFTTTMYVNPELQMTSISMGGVTLDVDESGIVEVPTANLRELKAHGLSETPFPGQVEEPEEEVVAKAPVKKKLNLGGKKKASS